jgi:hypothetical protein
MNTYTSKHFDIVSIDTHTLKIIVGLDEDPHASFSFFHADQDQNEDDPKAKIIFCDDELEDLVEVLENVLAAVKLSAASLASEEEE